MRTVDGRPERDPSSYPRPYRVTPFPVAEGPRHIQPSVTSGVRRDLQRRSRRSRRTRVSNLECDGRLAITEAASGALIGVVAPDQPGRQGSTPVPLTPTGDAR
jgi:hypothetical protein